MPAIKQILASITILANTFTHCSLQSPLTSTRLPREIQLIIAQYATEHLRDIVQQIDAHTKSINSLTTSLDGKYAVSSSSDSKTRLWALKPAIICKTLLANFRNWTSTEPASNGFYIPHVSALSPDGNYIATPTEDQLSINFWARSTFGLSISQLYSFDFNQKINDIAISPCSTYIALAHTSGATGTYTGGRREHYGFSLCPLNANSPLRFLPAICASTVRYSPTGNHIAVGTSQGIYLITITHEQTENRTTSYFDIELLPESSGISEMQLAFSPCGGYLYAASTLSMHSDKLIPSEKTEETDGGALHYTYRDRKKFGKLDIYSVHTKKIVQTLPEDRIVHALALSPDGKYMAIGSEPAHQDFWVHGTFDMNAKKKNIVTEPKKYQNALKIWDITLQEFVQTFDLNGSVTALAFSQNNLLVGLNNGHILLLKIKENNI